jgi:hypothetical protein
MSLPNKKETFITYNPSTNSFFLSPKQSIHQRVYFINKKINKSLLPLVNDNRTEPSCDKSNLCS